MMYAPIILVDWSTLKADNSLHLLSALLPSLGRSLPLYQEVHPESLLNNAEVHERFLNTLASLVPAGCRPVVVTDGGFKSNRSINPSSPVAPPNPNSRHRD